MAFEKSVYNIINIQQENGRLQEIERFIKRGKILDIGAGPGHFLKIGKDAGWDVYGQDLSKHAAAIAQKDFGIKVYDGTLKSLPYPDKFFDVVTMHSTIEHSLNPMTYIKIAYQKLKPGGLLVFSVPNVRSINFFLAKVLKLPYPGFIFEHLYYFTPRLIATMLTDKFTLVEMTSYHHSRPLYPQESKPKTQQKPKNKYAVFLKEIRQTKQKKLYIRQRFYTFQMRILREVLEYNRIGGKLQMGDVLYIFARKKVND